jgi:hypothetical protein
LGHALTWGDIYNILVDDEKERLWKAVEQHTDQLHEQHPSRHPSPNAAIEAVLKIEPHCSYQDGDLGLNSQDHMLSCLLADMDKNSHIQGKYDKIKEVTQDPDENPALFLNHLTEARTKYANLNPASQEGHIFLHVQSAPDLQKKLQKLQESPQIPTPTNLD